VSELILSANFFRTEAGNEPVREFLRALPPEDRKSIGTDIEVCMNKHIGSDFDDFLKEAGIQEEATAAAIKRVVAWQLAEAMKAKHITKTEMAARMRTSRAVVNRLLDEDDTSVTLATLARASLAVGVPLKVEFTSSGGA